METSPSRLENFLKKLLASSANTPGVVRWSSVGGTGDDVRDGGHVELLLGALHAALGVLHLHHGGLQLHHRDEGGGRGTIW